MTNTETRNTKKEKEKSETMKQETQKEKAERENFEHCRAIVDELEKIHSGELFKNEETGEAETVEEIETESGTLYRFASGTETDEKPEAFSLCDYLMDPNILDVEYIVDSSKNYKSARVCIAWGGPSIYIDTDAGAVCLYWWGETARAYMSNELINAIDSVMEKLFDIC